MKSLASVVSGLIGRVRNPYCAPATPILLNLDSLRTRVRAKARKSLKLDGLTLWDPSRAKHTFKRHPRENLCPCLMTFAPSIWASLAITVEERAAKARKTMKERMWNIVRKTINDATSALSKNSQHRHGIKIRSLYSNRCLYWRSDVSGDMRFKLFFESVKLRQP